ncbi:gluconokinase [Tautonia plasticadhaerens]|nr:gluconokinase [Tautonia plasticadhaerens]
MIIVLMGVSGSGKTTVGEVLADRLGWPFHDADAYHPEANIEKMHRGIPLDDDDRRPWLEALAELIDRTYERGEDIVLACSALKHSYQDYLKHDLADVRYVCLCGPEELIADRLAAREGHFMNPDLLESQLELLEPPEDAIRVDISGTPGEIAGEICRALDL